MHGARCRKLECVDQPRDRRIEVRATRDGARMAETMTPDERDQMVVGKRPRADEQGCRDVDRLIAEPSDEPRRSGRTFGQGCCDVAQRLRRNDIEKRQGEVVELVDFAAAGAGLRAEGRHGCAEQPFRPAALAGNRDLTEIRSRHAKTPRPIHATPSFRVLRHKTKFLGVRFNLTTIC